MPLRSRWLYPVLVVLGGLAFACTAEPPVPERPNIVLVIGDDHGYRDFGFMGSSIVQTPNLDELAREGMVFTHGFATASSCRPSLLSLLTGLHPEQWHARNAMLARRGRRRMFREIRDFATLPRVLGTAGYASFQGGKYWEGSSDFAGFTDGTKKCWGNRSSPECTVRALAGEPTTEQPDQPGVAQRVAAQSGEGAPSFGRTTLQPLWDFLDEHGGRQPFFVWFAPMLPHAPFDAPERFEAPYRGRGFTRSAERYYANVTRFDETLGELLEELERRRLREHTLVVYVADNGWEQWPHQATGPSGGPRGKHSISEIGFRTPVIINWPGWVPRGVNDGLVSLVDVFPTLLDFAGVETPPHRMGRSLRPALRSGGALDRSQVVAGVTKLRPTASVGAAPTQLVVDERAFFLRTPEWRYVWRADRDERSLFEIAEDPNETSDLAAAHPDVVERLQAEIDAWVERARAPYVKRES